MADDADAQQVEDEDDNNGPPPNQLQQAKYRRKSKSKDLTPTPSESDAGIELSSDTEIDGEDEENALGHRLEASMQGKYGTFFVHIYLCADIGQALDEEIDQLDDDNSMDFDGDAEGAPTSLDPSYFSYSCMLLCPRGRTAGRCGPG